MVASLFLAEWQSSLEMSVKCPLYRLKMSMPQGKIAIQLFYRRVPPMAASMSAS
jgi:hypothetical protein